MLNLIAVLCAFSTTAEPDTAADLAILHSAAVGRWESFDATFEMTENGRKYSTRVQKSGNRLRCEERSTENPADSAIGVSVAGKTLTVSTGPTYGQGSATITAGRSCYFMCNPAQQMLFGFLRFPEEAATLDEFISSPHKVGSVSRIHQDGRELVRLDVSVPNPQFPEVSWDFEYYFDPAVNYLVRKQVIRIDGKDENRTEREVTEFREVSPGTFFPIRAKAECYRRNKLVASIAIDATTLRMNEPIDGAVFQLSIPPGAFVVDRISGKQYHTDANGQISGLAQPVATAPLSAVIVTTAGDPAPSPYEQNRPSIVTGYPWVFWLIALIVCALIAYFVIRRRPIKL